MTNRVVSFLRDIATGAGINDAPWSVKRHIDDVTIASGTTSGAGAAAGKSVASRAALGYPGPVYLTQTTGGQTKIDSGQVLNQVGAIWLDDIPTILQLMGIGLLAGLNVSASGLTMSVSVSAGNAMLKDGLPFTLEAAVSVGPLAASHATLERYDRIVIRHQRRGATEEGKIEFAVLQGANAAVGAGVAPALTTSATTWELSLAKVLVSPNVTTIAANKVTIEATNATLGQYRGFVWPTASGTPMAIAAGDIFYLDLTQNFTPLHIGSSGQVLTITAGYPAWSSTVTGQIFRSSAGGAVPTGTPVGSYPAAGTGPTVGGIPGDDVCGTASITIGTSPSTGNLMKVNFQTPRADATKYHPVWSSGAGSTLPAGTQIRLDRATDGFTIVVGGAALVSGNTYSFHYHVFDRS